MRPAPGAESAPEFRLYRSGTAQGWGDEDISALAGGVD
jgi:hypothetical protein